ncbi:MAG: radical SAM protein [Spirochaetaceae bacterium]|nr:MAG: radical SAM protein [Spirochaetaceae bacterium]
MCPEHIGEIASEYATQITYREPRKRATSFHALELCRACGACVQIVACPVNQEECEGQRYTLLPSGQHGKHCPGRLEPSQLVLSPQGFGPARNIIAFTGGDLACQPEFYASCAEKIKALNLGLWVLLETNGYGLTPKNLDLLESAGIDAFWLDIKAYDEEVHRRLTGADNDWVLRLPEEILNRGFVLEVLSLFIPGWVETDQIVKIASLLAGVDSDIPFTLLAFFPQYQMQHVPAPTLEQMLSAYEAVRAEGLNQVRLGNLGIFVKNDEDFERLATAAPGGW